MVVAVVMVAVVVVVVVALAVVMVVVMTVIIMAVVHVYCLRNYKSGSSRDDAPLVATRNIIIIGGS